MYCNIILLNLISLFDKPPYGRLSADAHFVIVPLVILRRQRIGERSDANQISN